LELLEHEFSSLLEGRRLSSEQKSLDVLKADPSVAFEAVKQLAGRLGIAVAKILLILR
jgi:hypothetical protein